MEWLDIVLEALNIVDVGIAGAFVRAGGVVVSADAGILTFRLKANFVFPAVDERNSSSDFSNALSCFPDWLAKTSKSDTRHAPIHFVFDHSLEASRWLQSDAC